MRKMLIPFFSSNIPLYTGKNSVEKLCKDLEMELTKSAKLRALLAHVSTCLACLRAHQPISLACLHAHEPMCLACSRAYVPCVLTYPRVNVLENKFSITCFPYIFVIVLSFSCEIKLLYILAFLLPGGSL